MEASGSIVVVDEEALVAELKGKWKLLMTLGLLAIVAGCVSIAVPVITSLAIGIFIGWILVIGGALQLVDAMVAREKGRLALRLVAALATAGIGIWILTSEYKGTLALTTLLGIWFFIVGVIRLVAGMRERGTPGAGLVMVNGVFSLILGALILADLPSSADWAIGLLVGVDLLFAGIALVTTAVAAKSI